MTLNIELTDAEVEDLITVLTESWDEYAKAIEEYSDDSENGWSTEIADCEYHQNVIDKVLKALENGVPDDNN